MAGHLTKLSFGQCRSFNHAWSRPKAIVPVKGGGFTAQVRCQNCTTTAQLTIASNGTMRRKYDYTEGYLVPRDPERQQRVTRAELRLEYFEGLVARQKRRAS